MKVLTEFLEETCSWGKGSLGFKELFYYKQVKSNIKPMRVFFIFKLSCGKQSVKAMVTIIQSKQTKNVPIRLLMPSFLAMVQLKSMSISMNLVIISLHDI